MNTFRQQGIENLDLRFVTAQSIVAEVRNELPSLSNLNIDDTLLYPYIAKCLSRLGEKILPVKNDVLLVCNYKAKLPLDFYKLSLAMACWEGSVKYPLPRIHLEDRIITEAEMSVCERAYQCELCEDNCGNKYKIIQKFDYQEVEFQTTDLVRVSKQSRNYCENSCFNFKSNSENEITIVGNNILTSWSDGHIYIEYIASNTQDDYMIPDYPLITDWIKQELIYRLLLFAWNNGENDIRPRMELARQTSAIAETNAISFARRSEFSDYYNAIGSLVSRFNVHRDMVNKATFPSYNQIIK